MQVLKFKTNVKCGGCKKKVANFLDNNPSVSKWDIDLNDPDRVLVVEGNSINAQQIVQYVANAGFKAEII